MASKKSKSERSQNLRSVLIEELSSRVTDSKRDIPVMTRLSEELIGMLDILVKLDIFRSRSEAVAVIVESTLLTQKEKFNQLEEEISKLEKIQGKAKEIALDVLKG